LRHASDLNKNQQKEKEHDLEVRVGLGAADPAVPLDGERRQRVRGDAREHELRHARLVVRLEPQRRGRQRDVAEHPHRLVVRRDEALRRRVLEHREPVRVARERLANERARAAIDGSTVTPREWSSSERRPIFFLLTPLPHARAADSRLARPASDWRTRVPQRPRSRWMMVLLL